MLPLAKQVRLALPKAITLANLKRVERGQQAITMNALASEIGVAATSISRLARTDDKAASSFPLDLGGKIITVLDVGIGDLLEATENNE